MKSFIFLFVAVFTLPSSFGADPCGGLITTATGTIRYNIFDPIPANERCVWIIPVKDASSYKVTVTYIGFTDKENLIITKLARGSAADHHAVSTADKNKPITFDSTNVLIVTFASGATPGVNSNGFQITYTSESNPASGIDPTSKYVFVGPTEFHRAELSLANNEFSTFIFPPYAGLTDPMKKTKLIYIRKGDAGAPGDCTQKLEKLVFNMASSNSKKWESYGQVICDDIPSQIVEHDDLILVTLSTGEKPAAGFHFGASYC